MYKLQVIWNDKPHSIDGINRDDNISMLRKKICIALKIENPSDIYLFYKRKVKNDPAVVFNFVKNIFKKNNTIKYNNFQEHVLQYFGIDMGPKEYNLITKQQAVQLIMDVNPKVVNESLCFQYISDGFIHYFSGDPLAPHQKNAPHPDMSSYLLVNTFTLLLNTFDIKDDTIYAVSKVPGKVNNIYFPFPPAKITSNDKKLLADIASFEKEIMEVVIPKDTHIEATNSINYFTIKGNDLQMMNIYVDLETLFNALVTSKDIPFIKYKTPLNVFYKLHKGSLTHLPKDSLDLWTKISANKDDRSFIVLKMVFSNNSICSIIINNDLSYVVKATISAKEGARNDILPSIIPLANKILDVVKKVYKDYYSPEIPSDILKKSKETDIVRVINLITSTKLSSTVIGELDIKRVKNIVRNKMYPYFNLIDNKDPNILHLQYKKVNNYTKYSNIGMYISMNYWLPNDELVNQICMTFLISAEEAEKEVSSWKASHAVELEMDKGNKNFFVKPRGDNFVNIKMRIGNNIDLKYIVNGLTNTAMMKDIDDLIIRMIFLAEKQKAADKSAEKEAKKKITQLEKLETKINEKDNTQDVMVDMLADIITVDDDSDDILYRASPSSINDFEDDDEDMKALLMDFEEDLKKLEDGIVGNVSKNKVVKETPEPISNSQEEKVMKPGKKLKGYFLDKLYQADKNLFEYPVPSNKNDYASVCGWVDKRQPVVVSAEELEKINKEFPASINGHVKTGSTHELYKKNFYICPKIWCPKSRVALSYDDYVKFGRKCPYPEINEEPELFASKSYFGEGDAGLQKERYPKFLNKNMHPEKFCLPCCYKIKPSNKPLKDKDMCIMNNGSATNNTKTNVKNVLQQNVNINEEIEDPAAENKEKYIKGADYVPVDNNRFGLLPPILVEFFGQKDKQGSRHDGSGGMTDKTDAIFRNGVLQTRQSYLDALAVVLDNPNAKTSSQLVQLIHDKIDVLTYISLENGRIMKMFVDTAKTIYNKESFRAFYEWFKNQKKYILQMNLDRLLVEIEKANRVFDKDSLLHHADILREYIIYTSFMNFKEYLMNDRIPKDHMVLIDFISRSKDINVNKYNLIHLEYVHSETVPKVYAHCSVNKKIALDYNYPFVFLLKRDGYYEPLSYVSVKNGSVSSNMHIEYGKTKLTVIKKLIDFVKNNCNKVVSQDLPHMVDFLKGLGYKPKYYVIDYGYKTCGLILNHNIYVPLETRDDLYYIENIKYVYISDVPNFKCFLEKDTIKDVFKKIHGFTKSAFYKPKEFLDDGKWLVLEGGAHVPIKVSGDKDAYSFREGMFIFIGNEKDDKRKEIYAKFEKESQFIQDISMQLKDIMLKNESVNTEVKFLLDENNPLPLVYKKERLAEILKTNIPIAKKETVPDKMIYKLLNYMNEGSKHYKLYMARTRRFTWDDGEVLFDHYDILNGKLKDAIKFAENPQRAFLEVIDELNDEYIFEERVEVDYKDIILKDKLLEPPVKWRKLLKGYKVVDNDEVYNQHYMFDVFNKIAANNSIKSFNRDIYNSLVKRKTIEGFEKGNTLEVLDNPYLQSYFKKLKLTATLDLVLTQQESVYYYPSTFDIKIMANLARVSIVLIGRKTMKNPDGLEVIYNGSDIYTIISYSYDRFKVIDKFSFFNYGNKITFTTQELPAEFKDILAKKMVVYNVEV